MMSQHRDVDNLSLETETETQACVLVPVMILDTIMQQHVRTYGVA